MVVNYMVDSKKVSFRIFESGTITLFDETDSMNNIEFDYRGVPLTPLITFCLFAGISSFVQMLRTAQHVLSITKEIYHDTETA